MLFSNEVILKNIVSKTFYLKKLFIQNQYFPLIFLLLAIVYTAHFLLESLRCPEEAPESRMEKYNYDGHLACNGQPFQYE